MKASRVDKKISVIFFLDSVKKGLLSLRRLIKKVVKISKCLPVNPYVFLFSLTVVSTKMLKQGCLFIGPFFLLTYVPRK